MWLGIIQTQTCGANNIDMKLHRQATKLKSKFSLNLFSVMGLDCRPVGLGEQGWRSGESARLPPMWPGFESRTRRLTCTWVEFVVGSLLCSERFFSGYSGFPLSSKTNISKFQFDPGMHGHF